MAWQHQLLLRLQLALPCLAIAQRWPDRDPCGTGGLGGGGGPNVWILFPTYHGDRQSFNGFCEDRPPGCVCTGRVGTCTAKLCRGKTLCATYSNASAAYVEHARFVPLSPLSLTTHTLSPLSLTTLSHRGHALSTAALFTAQSLLHTLFTALVLTSAMSDLSERLSACTGSWRRHWRQAAT